MGSWGYGPYDGDTPADWFFGLKDIGLYDFIEKGLDIESYQIQRAAAWLVQRLAVSGYVYDTYIIDEHRKLAVEKLEAMLKDEDWINSWREPEQAIAEIKKQIHEIQNPEASPGLLERICGCAESENEGESDG